MPEPISARTDLGFEHVFEPGASGGGVGLTGFARLPEGGHSPLHWTLLLLHGTGGDEHDLVPLGRQLAPGAALLSPRGKVLEGGVARRFFRRLAVGQLDIPDLLERTDELAQFVRAAADAYGLDPRRIMAVGLSNGANIAVSLLWRHPGLLRGAALLRPMLPYQPEPLPELVGTDVLVAAGAHDPYTSPPETERLVQTLRAAGARVVANSEPSAGHGLTQNDLVLTARWARDLTTS